VLAIQNHSLRSLIPASLLAVSCWLVVGANPAAAASCAASPSAPTGLMASGTVGSGTFVSWSAVAPPANCTISSYRVLMNGSSIGTAAGTSFAVTGLSPSTLYSFEVEATDAAGSSAASSALNVTTQDQPAGTAYYVSKTGNNSNTGLSPSAAWLTISYAASKVTAGDTVYVGAGTYSESVPITTSGTASAPIIFDGQGVAIVDGTSVACCTSPTFVSSNGFVGTNTQGLFSIGNSPSLNYVTIEGFTIQNYKTTSVADVPAGILIVGGGTGINVLDNTVQNIESTAKQTKKAGPNAYGIGVFGTSSTPLSVNVSHNTVTGCLTGESETTTYNGNVQNFTVSYNTIYGNDNIGMDAIGFEGVGPTGLDQAKNGDVFGNIIYDNSAINNPGEQGGGQDGSYDEDGLYCDGCTQVVFERNLVYANDINIEAASENKGEVSSYVIIRNNVTYGSNSAGITVGGYQAAGVGGSTNITIVNNTLYDDDLQNTGSGEFQIQFRATGIVFENNIVYAGAQGLFIHGFVPGSGVTLNYNDYYTTSSTTTFELDRTSYSTFAKYRSATGQDEESVYANPAFHSLPTCNKSGTTPPGGYSDKTAATCVGGNLDIPTTSSAANVGNAALGSPSGSAYSAYQLSEPFVGTTDFDGNERVNSSGEINIGAFEQ
jgi:chitodextrinase